MSDVLRKNGYEVPRIKPEGVRNVYKGEKYLSTKGPPSIKGKDRGNKQQQFTRRKLSDSVAEGNNQGRTR